MKPEYVTDEMIRAFVNAPSPQHPDDGNHPDLIATDAAQLDALKAEIEAIRAARDLALASLCKQDAEIDSLKAERDALRKDADLWRYALKRGVITVHSERIVDHDSGTRCSWIQGHYKAADVPNAAVIKETKNG